MLDRSAQLLGAEATRAQSLGKTLRRLGGYFRRYLWAVVLTGLLIVAATYMQITVPDLTGQAVDCYLGPFTAGQSGRETAGGLSGIPGDLQASIQGSQAFGNCWYTTPNPAAETSQVLAGLGGLILLIIALYTGSAVISGIQFYLMAWAGNYALRDIQVQVFKHLHRLSLGYFNRQESGDVMSRFTSDIDTLQQVIGFGLVSVFQGGLLIVWTIWVMFEKSLGFALVSLVTLPLMIVVTQWLSNQARRAFRQARKEIGAVNADLQESISSVREVQAFGREEENIQQFNTQNAANRDANVRAQMFTSALAPSLEALSYVSLAIVAAVGGFYILSGRDFLSTTLSVGLIITFINYSQQFNRPVQQIALLWTNLQSAIAGAERIFTLLDQAPDIADAPDARPMPEIRGHVRFERVEAEYNPGDRILKGIDLEASPGETIAIVGPTGAGKTTIINLIPRFWDVTAGRILIDGLDIRSATRDSLRRQIGIVLQDTFLFSDTVMNNIRYGRPEATDDEVVAAARLARANDFITKLSSGYETVLGERGSGLSQGQRQLIAIARVALTDPKILILDEATSSVDTRTEMQIQEALERLHEGRTSFVIAHRLSTIRNADQVLVLRDGEIIERGRHQSLFDARGFYHDLYMKQFRRRIETDEPSIPI